MSKESFKRKTSKIFVKQSFRWSVLFIFSSIVVYRLISTGGHILAIRAVFASICLITTVIAIVMAVFIKPRAWCAVCPMGTLQDKVANNRA